MDRIRSVEVKSMDIRTLVATGVDEVIIDTPAGTFSLRVDNFGHTCLRVLDGLLVIRPEAGNSTQIAQVMELNWEDKV